MNYRKEPGNDPVVVTPGEDYVHVWMKKKIMQIHYHEAAFFILESLLYWMKQGGKLVQLSQYDQQAVNLGKRNRRFFTQTIKQWMFLLWML